MRKFDIQKASIRFPQREVAHVFMGQNGSPFVSATIGITYPFAAYSIQRGSDTKKNLLEFVQEGRGEVWINGRWKSVQAGEVYILRQDEEHRYRCDPERPMKKIWINYIADYMGSFLDAYRISSNVYNGKGVEPYFEQLLQYTQMSSYDSRTCFGIADCVQRIVQEIAVQCVQESADDVQRIYSALHSGVYRQVSLDELAQELHISKSNLIRLFKKQYGVTPYEYLLRLKMDAAKLLLRNTQMSVKEIARRICICDEHYFSSLFLKRIGVRPRDYRLGHRK